MTTSAARHWLWVDVETTGLGYDPDQPARNRDDVILEIAAIITTPDLQEVSSFGPFAIAARQSDLDLMGDYVRDMHTRTGLLDRVTSSAAYSLDTVQDGMASWMQEHGLTERVILAGNSVKLDFDFLRRHMPRVFSRLGYRVIDVSSFKEALRDWAPAVVAELEGIKNPSHKAMDDIRWSVRELDFYRRALGVDQAATDESESGVA